MSKFPQEPDFRDPTQSRVVVRFDPAQTKTIDNSSVKPSKVAGLFPIIPLPSLGVVVALK